MTRLTRLFLLGLSFGVFLLGSQATADVVNGSFENGMASWTSVGPNSSVPNGSVNGLNATDGSNYAFINNGAGAQAVLIQDFVLASLGISANYIATNFPSATEGAILFQQFTLNAGANAISFDWVFATDESTPDAFFNDFGFAHLFDSSLANIDSATIDTFASFPNTGGSEIDSDTDWLSVTFSGLTAGNAYTLVFGVFDLQDSTVDSALLVDNVRAVPEPGSISLLAISGLALLAPRRRSHR